LFSFLERHPQITNIILCLDNDKAGREATGRIIKELLSDKRFSHMKITTAPSPNGFKDYTDVAQAMQQLNMRKLTTNRPKEAVI
jgi:DNA primase